MAVNPRILVAYDGSPHAGDALAFGSQLAAMVDGQLELAHVHPTAPVQIGGEASHAGREAFLSRRSEELLAEGAARVGQPDIRRHVIAATTTATGLRELGERESLDVIVFGSASSTTPGRVHPGSAARRLLQNGPVALAFAPADHSAAGAAGLRTIGFAVDDEANSARQSADAIASHVAADVVEGEHADLVVVGSRPAAPPGLVQVSPAAERAIQRATAPVLVVARARAVFGSALVAAA